MGCLSVCLTVCLSIRVSYYLSVCLCLYTRYCSVAAFGVTADLSPRVLGTGGVITAEGLLDFADNEDSCKVPTATTSTSSSTSSTGKAASWWSALWGDGEGAALRDDNDSKGPYEGKIVMASRGGCMFEDKAIQAELSGASGLIIFNYEV